MTRFIDAIRTLKNVSASLITSCIWSLAVNSLTTITPPEFYLICPDSKLKMLMQLSEHAEIVIVISAGDIEKIK